MQRRSLGMAFVLALLAGGAPASEPHGPYAGQETRPIKALDPETIAGLKSGAGLGYAKSAELNGYPGPAHLLELADRLPLSAEQRTRIAAIQAAMRRDVIRLGEDYLAAEQALEAAFQAGGLDAARLGDLAAGAGAAESALRARHLAAHLEAAALLDHSQVQKYAELRGYAANRGHGAHRH